MKTVGDLISSIEEQFGTSITDPVLLERPVTLNIRMTTRSRIDLPVGSVSMDEGTIVIYDGAR